MYSPFDAESLLAAARGLPQGNDAVWHRRLIIWKEPATWMPALTAWLSRYFRADAMQRLRPNVFRDICWDDTHWLDVLARSLKDPVEYRTNDLADALLASVIRTYHGCRTHDAGTYFRNGLLVHRKEQLKARALSIIKTHPELHYMQAQLDEAIARIDNTIDDGKCYVAVSDEGLLDQAAHYLIYGSEWIMALFKDDGRSILRKIGAPTLIEIDLPFSTTHNSDRHELAKHMLREWTRLACNGQEWVAPINCTFFLAKDVPGECIVGHTHPAILRDPLDRERIYRSPVTTCKYCNGNPEIIQ